MSASFLAGELAGLGSSFLDSSFLDTSEIYARPVTSSKRHDWSRPDSRANGGRSSSGRRGPRGDTSGYDSYSYAPASVSFRDSAFFPTRSGAPPDMSAPSQSASALYCAADSVYGEGEGNLIERFDQPGARLLSAVASPSEILGRLVYGPTGERLGYPKLASTQSACAVDLSRSLDAHESTLDSLRAYLGSVARARRALPSSNRTPRASTTSVHTSWLGPSARASHIQRTAGPPSNQPTLPCLQSKPLPSKRRAR